MKLQDKRMIITITGKPGSGKSTIAKMLARHYRLKFHCTGDFVAELAMKRGLSLLELSKEAEKGRGIDEIIDRRNIELGKREKNFVIDSRLAFHFIPNSIKVFLDVSLDEGARRIFGSYRPDERENTTLAKTKQNIKRRMRSEEMRFRKYYGLNVMDRKNYDIVVNTTKLSINGVFDAVRKGIDKKQGCA